jgi:hypothetical protein
MKKITKSAKRGMIKLEQEEVPPPATTPLTVRTGVQAGASFMSFQSFKSFIPSAG